MRGVWTSGGGVNLGVGGGVNLGVGANDFLGFFGFFLFNKDKDIFCFGWGWI